MSDASSSLERRRAVRVSIVIPIEVRDGHGFTLHSSSDLSVGGVYFDRAIPHKVGTRVDLSFNLPGDARTVVCAGEVVNVPDVHAYGMGVRFIDLSAGDEAMLYEFIGGQS
jgi:uncharacterized protein (TIGR02266 family)